MRAAILILPFALAACESPSLRQILQPRAEPVETGQPLSATGPVETLDPTPPPPPPPEARTVDEFDTATEEDQADALAAPAATGSALGTTLATLGSPADPGIWLKTPLVSQTVMGRVEYQGNSINIELRPSGAEAGSGSQLSLSAMRLIDAPLTEIVELAVFRS
ncbi:D-galactarate dehydratase [Roseisalinus antarcticus]|uniref:D-galactarate dehydratase n=1 Tax=Roseisalinus antarcticus TaxID=254357 RepID=A0A1Y5SHR4_9RHOB|nr:D-galactarate dehydratase [Roseisalinus antarcticus]SLN41080.1 hypothetical protein ROA7023_01624 [Roseisalinus antarcticus]